MVLKGGVVRVIAILEKMEERVTLGQSCIGGKVCLIYQTHDIAVYVTVVRTFEMESGPMFVFWIVASTVVPSETDFVIGT